MKLKIFDFIWRLRVYLGIACPYNPWTPSKGITSDKKFLAELSHVRSAYGFNKESNA